MYWRDLPMNLLSDVLVYNSNQKRILLILLKKYEESRSYTNTNKVNQSFKCSPDDIYKDYYSDYANLELVESLRNDIAELERIGLVTVKRSSTDIDAVIAVTEKYSEYCEIVGVTEKNDRLKSFENFLKEYVTKSNTLSNLCNAQLKRLENHKEIAIAENPNELDKILECIEYIEANKLEIMERELSIQLFSDSKLFERKYKTKICSLLMEYGDYTNLAENEPDKKRQYDLILSENQIVKNPTYIYFKGSGKIIYNDGMEIQLSPLHPIAIISTDLLKIEKFIVFSENIITIENLTNYTRMNLSNYFQIYLSGYNNSAKSNLLKAIHNTNSNKKWYHFGDIDPDGFYILTNLRRTTGIFFIPYKMGIDWLSTYSTYTKPLEKNDIVKAKKLLCFDEFSSTINYMLEHNCKLEQEIISWNET